MKYMKKPVLVDAIQWNNTHERFVKIVELKGKVTDPLKMITCYTAHGYLYVPIIDNDVKIANPGDWVIKDAHGNFHVETDKRFRELFEEVKE